MTLYILHFFQNTLKFSSIYNIENTYVHIHLDIFSCIIATQSRICRILFDLIKFRLFSTPNSHCLRLHLCCTVFIYICIFIHFLKWFLLTKLLENLKIKIKSFVNYICMNKINCNLRTLNWFYIIFTKDIMVKIIISKDVWSR